ncbi:MAG: hypothetical protein AAF411_25835 [Myxococcota bacterium]
MLLRPIFTATLLALVLSACAHFPDRPATRGLYVDLAKSVDSQETLGWTVDRLAVESLRDEAMGSVCRSEAGAAEDLNAWISTRVADELGAEYADVAEPGAVAFRLDGGMSARVKRLRRLERVRLLLNEGEQLRAECPYWTEASPDFAGVEGDDGRLVLWAESSGAGTLRFSDGTTGFGGGGSGRIALAYGFGRVTLALGFGVGAEGALPETADGGRSFEAFFSTNVPLVLRVTNVSRIFDIEVSYRTIWTSDRLHGVRAALAYGLTTRRISGLLPYGVLTLGYEVFPDVDGNIEHAILLGTRVGFDWDP